MVTNFLSLEPVGLGDSFLENNQIVKNSKTLGGSSQFKIVQIRMIKEKTGLLATDDIQNVRELKFSLQAIEKNISLMDLVDSGCCNHMNIDGECFSILN